MSLTGTILGYDPGGNGCHGVALFTYDTDHLVNRKIATLETVDEVIEYTHKHQDLIAVGVDTLTIWSTGNAGWRPADRWLRKEYKAVFKSITSANSLAGSMGLNGMSVLISLREAKPELVISETHPKVLYNALVGKKYDYSSNQDAMDRFLSEALSTEITTNNDHEWDAVVSVYAVLQGLKGEWERDLHLLPCSQGEHLIHPSGKTHYWWSK